MEGGVLAYLAAEALKHTEHFQTFVPHGDTAVGRPHEAQDAALGQRGGENHLTQAGLTAYILANIPLYIRAKCRKVDVATRLAIRSSVVTRMLWGLAVCSITPQKRLRVVELMGTPERMKI